MQVCKINTNIKWTFFIKHFYAKLKLNPWEKGKIQFKLKPSHLFLDNADKNTETKKQENYKETLIYT